ncbi:MAG: carboxymuconolactone decarboxylase family protein [Pseudomonadota bacterium]
MTNNRYPALNENNLTPDQQRVYDAIASGPRGGVRGPLRVWLQSPQLAQRAQALGQFARYDSSLDPVLSELAILVTARIWGSGYEWGAHAPIAKKAGLDGQVIAAIASASRPVFDNPAQSAVFEFAVDLHRDRRVADTTYACALDLLGTAGVVDLVGICGYYTLISMTINVFDVPSDGMETLPALNIPPEDMFR